MSLEAPARVPALSYFFPAHNEEANLEALVLEALDALPALADRFEIIAVDDGSKDATAAIADRLAAAHPDVVRAVHHPTNLGYGAALRSGFRAARYDLVCFTDGDRQFRVADLGRLTGRLGEADAPDVVVGHRIKRADPPIRTIYARLYKLANRVWFGLRVRDVDCACKLFRRAALEGVRVESGGAFFSAELLIKLRAAGRSVVEVGVPHYPRTAGSPTGARPSVIWRAVKDFWGLRLRMWANRARALRRGEAIVEPRPGPDAGRGLLARRPLPGPVGARLDVERVHEVAEDREALLVDGLVVARPGRSPRRRGRGPPPRRRCARPVRTARARASDGRESISRIRPAVSSRIRAWNVSSARSAITTSRIVAPSSSRTPANRSWVERPLRGEALELHRDRVRLPRPDPDRQDSAGAPGP